MKRWICVLNATRNELNAFYWSDESFWRRRELKRCSTLNERSSEIESKMFKKASSSRRLMLNTSKFLSRVARSKSKVFNFATLSCIEDRSRSTWWTRLFVELRRDVRLRYLILSEYLFWMIWRIRLSESSILE